MIRRQSALAIVAAVYFVGLTVLFLTPNDAVTTGSAGIRWIAPWASEPNAEAVIGVALFVPMGVLLVLITGRRRWVTVLVVGVVACCWLRLAEMVLLPRGRVDADSVMPHIVGTVLGIGIMLAFRARTAGASAVRVAAAVARSDTAPDVRTDHRPG